MTKAQARLVGWLAGAFASAGAGAVWCSDGVYGVPVGAVLGALAWALVSVLTYGLVEEWRYRGRKS